MQKNPIGWVEIPVADLDRAEKFYKDYFGFACQRQPEMAGHTMSWLPMDMESYGSAATLMHGPAYTPSHEGPVLYFTAPGGGSVSAGVAKAEELGIKVIKPTYSIGDHGFVAVLEDTECNRIAIHSIEE